MNADSASESWEHTVVPCPTRGIAERVAETLGRGAARAEAEFAGAMADAQYTPEEVSELLGLYRSKRQRRYRLQTRTGADELPAGAVQLHASSCGQGGYESVWACPCAADLVTEILTQRWDETLELYGEDVPDPRGALLSAELSGWTPRTRQEWGMLEELLTQLERAPLPALLLAELAEDETRTLPEELQYWEERYSALPEGAQEVLTRLLVDDAVNGVQGRVEELLVVSVAATQ